MTEGDKPAYPSEFEGGEYDAFGAPVIAHRKYYGLTKREYFAAMAMQGMYANPEISKAVTESVNSGKYEIKFGKEFYAEMGKQAADALIEALNKQS